MENDITAGGSIEWRAARMADTVAVTLPRCLANFAKAMEAKLIENERKGGWLLSRTIDLYDRLEEECKELFNELGELPPFLRNEKAVTKEAADVANFAMFIAMVAGDLEG